MVQERMTRGDERVLSHLYKPHDLPSISSYSHHHQHPEKHSTLYSRYSLTIYLQNEVFSSRFRFHPRCRSGRIPRCRARLLRQGPQLQGVQI